MSLVESALGSTTRVGTFLIKLTARFYDGSYPRASMLMYLKWKLIL